MIELEICFRRLPHGANLPAPAYQSPHAAGMDLVAAVPTDGPIIMTPGQRAIIPTGIAIALPPGTEGQIRPRSGLALRHGLTILNAPGTIDPDYRGEVGVLLINLGYEAFTVTRGMRIAQLIISQATRARLREVKQLDDTERGAGGFGSTGTETSIHG